MIRSMSFLVFYFLQTLGIFAQGISDIESRYYNEQDFRSFDTLHHEATSTQFELGFFSPKGYDVVYDSKSSRSYYQRVDTTATDLYLNETAVAYLKSTKENSLPAFIPLQLVEDFDLLKFIPIKSEKIILYKNRYAFGIYDVNTQKTGSSQQPGAYKYEGEDAMSSLLSGFSFFDNEKFLFGHVQAYGIFCYDISNPINPIELRRYALSERSEGIYYDNQGEHHVFLQPKENDRWDVLLASSDTTSSPSIPKLYSRLKEMRYVKKDVLIKLDHASEPKVAIDPEGRIQIQLIDDSFLSIDLVHGTITQF